MRHDRCSRVGIIGWPPHGPVEGQPHASTTTCAHPENQKAAAEWVKQQTGHAGLLILDTERRNARQDGHIPPTHVIIRD